MKQLPFLVIVILGLCLSCNKPAKDSPLSVREGSPEAKATRCYVAAMGQDSAFLALTMAGHTVTGNLSYHYYQKDRNTGTLQGTIKGDTLIADYTFWSEGTESVREVVLLKQNDQWVEGYGPVKAQNGKMVFIDLDSLTYGSGWVLKPTACSN